MSKIEIINEQPISMTKLKNELSNIKKRDEGLNFRANKTEEYLNEYSKLSVKKSEELYSEIEKLEIPRLKDFQIIKIIDLLPQTVDELKSMLQGYTLSITKENMAKIISVVKKHQ